MAKANKNPDVEIQQEDAVLRALASEFGARVMSLAELRKLRRAAERRVKEEAARG